MTLNEILFYGGFILAIAFFVLAVVLFFANRVPSALGYFFKMGKRGFHYQRVEVDEETAIINSNEEQAPFMVAEGPTEILEEPRIPARKVKTTAAPRTHSSAMEYGENTTEVLAQGENIPVPKPKSRKTNAAHRQRNIPRQHSAGDETTEVLE